jgi:Spy/CpxP family protein refolding chaperone
MPSFLRSALATALVSTLTLSSCAPMAPPEVQAAPPAGEKEDERLPAALEELHLRPDQRREIEALKDDLERDLEPLLEASKHLGRAIAVALRECKGDSPFIDMEASTLVGVGEELRPRALDAIQRFHRILTPAQRRALSQRLLASDAERAERRGERDRSSAESIGGKLDLSVGQMFSMLLRVQLLRSSFEDQLKPWRARYRKALKAFARDDFDIRRQAVAEVPFAELATTLVRDGLRMLVPVLDPPQCQEVARLLDEQLDKKKEKRE